MIIAKIVGEMPFLAGLQNRRTESAADTGWRPYGITFATGIVGGRDPNRDATKAIGPNVRAIRA